METNLKTIVETLQLQRGLDKDIVIKAIEKTLTAVVEKRYPYYINPTVKINITEGKQIVSSEFEIVEKPEYLEEEISLENAKKIKADAKLGDIIFVDVSDKMDFSRIGASLSKNTLIQKLSDFEREQKILQYEARIDTIISGEVVEFVRNGGVMIDLSDAQALLPREERPSFEKYTIGSKIEVLLKEISQKNMRTNLICSRTDDKFIIKLFEREIEEIRNDVVVIKAIAREPGFKTKVAVFSNDPKINASSACIGTRGMRIRHIVRELNKEKIDIIPWSPNIEVFVKNSFENYPPIDIAIDEETETIYLTFKPEDHALAVGKRGVNVRLISKLIGYQIILEGNEKIDNPEMIEDAKKNLAKVELLTDYIDLFIKNKIYSIKDLCSLSIRDIQDISNDQLSDEQAQSILEFSKSTL